MSPLQEIQAHSSLREVAFRAIWAGIVTGEIHPEQIYSAPTLARQLGVSATPVREAMLDLAAQGLVEPVRNRGFRILPLTDEDLDQIYELRMLIEVPTIGRLAGTLPKREVTRLQKLAKDSEAAAQTGDLVRFLDADRTFHLGLLEHSGNRRLVEFIGQLRAQTRLYGLRELADAGALVSTAREHRLILDRIESGDTAGAEEQMAKHLQHTRGAWAGRAEAADG